MRVLEIYLWLLHSRGIGKAKDGLSTKRGYFQEIPHDCYSHRISNRHRRTHRLWPGGLEILLNRLVNRWVAGIIARREFAKTARAALRHRDNRGLKDIGIDQHQLGDAFSEIARERLRLQRRGQTD